MAKFALSKKWKLKKPMIGALLFELAGITAALTMFGIAAPDTYRTKLWADGGRNGFNSDPTDRLYFYANYKTPPAIPLIWSETLTNFNVAVSIIFMFGLLIKAVLFVVHCLYPLLALLYALVALGLWIFSTYGQLSPDYSDPKHPATVPWYFTHSCSAAFKPGNAHYCQLARGSLAATIFMVALNLVYAGLAIHSLIIRRPFAAEKEIDNDSQASIEMYHQEPVSAPQPQPQVAMALTSSAPVQMNNNQQQTVITARSTPSPQPVGHRAPAFRRLDSRGSLPLREYNPADYA